MAIKRNSFRASEVIRMRRMSAEGYSAEQISNACSVMVGKVEYVLSGEYDKDLEVAKKERIRLAKERLEAPQKRADEEAARLGTAVAQGLKEAGLAPAS